jgi:DsbC/DsbD-like thiol-disulfide interchange protein
MKKAILFFALLVSVIFTNAQNPVSWSFSAKKISDKTFEVHLTATIQPGWHMYSQNQPDDAIAIPTGIKYNNNPLLIMDGKTKELGKMEKYSDAKLGISANQYSNSVDFVQVVKLKGKAKTNISGSVEYQTCDDKKCLPPKTANFSIALK